MQPPFDRTAGVTATRVGFAGGRQKKPTYQEVSAGESDHREAIEISFDPTKISYAQLLEIFWQNINPVQRDGQFRDFGEQYTSAVFYRTEEERVAAETSKEALAQSGRFQKPIATVVLPVVQFWPAEEYHQKYYLKNPAAYGMYVFASGRAAFKQRFWGKGR